MCLRERPHHWNRFLIYGFSFFTQRQISSSAVSRIQRYNCRCRAQSLSGWTNCCFALHSFGSAPTQPVWHYDHKTLNYFPLFLLFISWSLTNCKTAFHRRACSFVAWRGGDVLPVFLPKTLAYRLRGEKKPFICSSLICLPITLSMPERSDHTSVYSPT